jgi:hypothetical protein
VKDLPRVKIYTSLEPGQSWGLAYIGIDGIEARKFNEFLWNKYRIIGQAMVQGAYPGSAVRLSGRAHHAERLHHARGARHVRQRHQGRVEERRAPGSA